VGVIEQKITEKYAAYNGDAMEVMPTLPEGSIHLSMYSPPFGGLYTYSSDPRDLSNSLDLEEFWKHYEFIINEIHRVTMPGRMSAVHCMDIPTGNTGLDHLMDFPGEVIRLHERCGWAYIARYHVWKEPLTVRNRTMTKSLSHKGLTIDSTRCSIANADYLLIFRRSGENPIPVAHPQGLTSYAGSRPMPRELIPYRNWKGNQIENRYSHWIWQRYADAFWDDVRIDRVLNHRPARDEEDERHVHPLQLDVIDRALTLWSNPGETMLTPFMGVGSEVYGAVKNGRRAIGVELKESYYRQALKNLAEIEAISEDDQYELCFEQGEPESVAAQEELAL
jgi:DNA modification methylase